MQLLSVFFNNLVDVLLSTNNDKLVLFTFYIKFNIVVQTRICKLQFKCKMC